MLAKHLIALVLISIQLMVTEGQNDPTVKIAQGTLKGTEERSAEGLPYFSFKGIPYAKSPIGERRFRKPDPAEPWEGVLEAKTEKVCLQSDVFDHGVVKGEEDCLVVNVYTPVLPSSSGDKPLAVMVWIHGGGFIAGSGGTRLYGPDYFMDKDVVLVTMNYRLGPLGFLSTFDTSLPGNYGLWDQRLALVWVQQNIAAFGGDPGRVTIFGESAGGAAVMHHYFSPQSARGLFHAAIAMSGVPGSTFARVGKNPAYYARTLASEVGCDPSAESNKLKQCLNKVDGETLVVKAYNIFSVFGLFPYPFKPIVDSFVPEGQGFLPKDPWTMLDRGEFNPLPLIIGHNKEDGLLFVTDFIKDPSKYETLKNEWETLAPLLMFYREADDLSTTERSIVNDYLRTNFGGSHPNELPPSEEFVNMFSDVNFNAITTAVSRRLAAANRAPVYEYEYSHVGSASLTDVLALPRWKLGLRALGSFVGLDILDEKFGTCHADELFVMFKATAVPLDARAREGDKMAGDNLVNLWTNFAKTKNPTPENIQPKWERVTKDAHGYMDINSQLSFQPYDDKYEARLKQWESIWAKVPPMVHQRSSVTWKNPKMFKDSKKRDKSKSEL